MSYSFLKIFIELINKNINKDKIITEYIKFLIKNKCIFDDKYILLLLNTLNNNDIIYDLTKYLITSNKFNLLVLQILSEKNKDIIKNTDILFDILESKNENLFYSLINIFDKNELEKLFNNKKDNDDNTLYHYICKNNLCFGFNINNKIRNKKGFKPLELCEVNIKYYKSI